MTMLQIRKSLMLREVLASDLGKCWPSIIRP